MTTTNRPSGICADSLTQIQADCHRIAREHGWWTTPEDKSVPVKLALIHSEVSEALEEYRDAHPADDLAKIRYEFKATDRVPKDAVIRKAFGKMYAQIGDGPSFEFDQTTAYDLGYDVKPIGFAIELADAMIRIMDLAGHLGIDLTAAITEKMAYNETRPLRHGGKTI